MQETVGDLSFVVSRGEMEGRRRRPGRSGWTTRGSIRRRRWYRKQLVDEMSKAGVEHAEKLLANPQFSMVIVRLTIPIGVIPTDRLDVQVEVPPACGTTSLAGGYLLMTRLREVPGRRNGVPGRATRWRLPKGPIMIGTPAKPNDPKVGRVLGGGKVKKDYPFTLVIKENRESFRTSKMLETVVNERFHQIENGHQKGVATAKTPSYLELKVPTLYHQNQEHFFRVVQLLPMIDSPELRARRMAAWSKELLDPTTAGVAAMKLEGLGTTAVEPLKDGLKSPNAQVRFFSAEALAYLNDTAGVDALGETVVNRAEIPGLRPGGPGGPGPAGISPEAAQADGRARDRGPLRRVQRPADARSARPVPGPGPRASTRRNARMTTRSRPTRWRSPSRAPRAVAAASGRSVRSLRRRFGRAPPRPRFADPPVRDRRLRPPAEAPPADRPGHRLDLAQRRRQRRQDRAQQDRAQPVRRCRHQDHDVAGARRGASASRPTWAPATPRSSPSSRPPSGRRTWPASSSSTPCPSPTAVYLEAVLGKDTTAKRDDAVKRTSGEIVTLSTAPALRSLRREQPIRLPRTAPAASKDASDRAAARDATRCPSRLTRRPAPTAADKAVATGADAKKGDARRVDSRTAKNATTPIRTSERRRRAARPARRLV